MEVPARAYDEPGMTVSGSLLLVAVPPASLDLPANFTRREFSRMHVRVSGVGHERRDQCLKGSGRDILTGNSKDFARRDPTILDDRMSRVSNSDCIAHLLSS